ncbi:MAG: ATP-binding protein [Chloroflexi bacterium]|nr:ATP-binding protein [Chloroflexota bacterium]MCI0574890.1 ATP-binding protein [Chloroflexota bacterium]MCI0648392.1 ATP-binding protein [Chloroflexota bacterium]MCI0727513.1 ATP-binding protein [Chloroflexota bacterium]
MKFVGRKREGQTLENFYHSPEAGLLILYGRRRIGKTRLITHFLKQHSETPAFYWMATTHGEAFQLRDFSQAILRHDPRLAGPPTEDFIFASWENALQHLADVVQLDDRLHVVVLDEFTYLLRNEPAISSVFQKMWDHHLSKIPQLKLVLTGSLIGMMARQVFSYQAPLYGRATAQIHLHPLPYAAIGELFPERPADERVAIYGVTGGVPAYLEFFTRTKDFVSALRDHCLAPGSMMMSDPAVILYEQLQEPQTYESILSAIAAGFHQWSDIAKMAGVTETALGHYLKILQELEFIERREPVLAKPTSKRGRYHVRDHFLRFYYRFVVPQLGSIERGYQEAAVAKIYAELRPFLGTYVFEELCREWVWAAAMSGRLDFTPEVVGSYWRAYGRTGVQLDVVAAAPREKKLLIGEAKWGRDALGRQTLADLIQRSQRMPEVAEGWTVQYALFGHEGFTDALRAEARARKALLVSLEELEETLFNV